MLNVTDITSHSTYCLYVFTVALKAIPVFVVNNAKQKYVLINNIISDNLLHLLIISIMSK